MRANIFTRNRKHYIIVPRRRLFSHLFANLTAKMRAQVKLLLHNFFFKNNKIALIATAASMILFDSKLFTFSAQINISYNDKSFSTFHNLYDEEA